MALAHQDTIGSVVLEGQTRSSRPLTSRQGGCRRRHTSVRLHHHHIKVFKTATHRTPMERSLLRWAWSWSVASS